jgi:hypothetical protein
VRKYLKSIYRVLTAVSVVIALLVFITGKTELTEYVKMFRNYFGMSQEDNAHTNYIFLEGTDNLLTTIFKTFFVILAIFFLTIASIISCLLEIIIWAVSLGTYKFYCMGEIWDLLWTRIVSNWYWIPSKSLYLWITYLLYSGFFGTGSVDRGASSKNNNNGRHIKTSR